MELKILGSSSASNCYILDNGSEALVIECGVTFNDVKKAMNFDISRIQGCLLSHEHGDHSKYAHKFLEAHIPVFTSKGTSEHIISTNKPTVVSVGEVFNVGKFKIQAFDVQHDCAEPFGFLIYHPETGMILFATDTYYLKYTFPNLNNILVECNYHIDILESNIESGQISSFRKKRTVTSHMSYDTCVETLLANDLSAVNNIVLIHLSDANSDASRFKKGIKEVTGKNVHVADKGMILNFNKTPF